MYHPLFRYTEITPQCAFYPYWLSFLESIGYCNDNCMILNALDFGIPQDRERAFIVSHLGSYLDEWFLHFLKAKIPEDD